MERIQVSGLSGPVVGRVDEVQRLRTLVKVAVSGHGAAALIEGEPGIGKTTLLDAAAAEADRLGARVLRGAATEPEYRVPFAAIGSCLAASARAGDPAAVRLAAPPRGEGRPPAPGGAGGRGVVVPAAHL